MPRRCVVAAAQERVRPYREDPAFVEHRRRVLARAHGRILDLSLRTQANRELLPGAQVSDLTVVSGGPAPAQVWVSAPPGADGAGRPAGPLSDVRLIAGPLHADTFAPASFDTVVSVLTLCTVGDLEAMLEAIGRWLAPSGQLLMLEHIRATGFTAMAQAVATPFERRLMGGCRLDQDLVGACRHTDLDLTDGARFSVRVAASLPIPCLAGVARPRARNRGRS
jgi:SAM-dependent methyltransferase